MNCGHYVDRRFFPFTPLSLDSELLHPAQKPRVQEEGGPEGAYSQYMLYIFKKIPTCTL